MLNEIFVTSIKRRGARGRSSVLRCPFVTIGEPKERRFAEGITQKLQARGQSVSDEAHRDRHGGKSGRRGQARAIVPVRGCEVAEPAGRVGPARVDERVEPMLGKRRPHRFSKSRRVGFRFAALLFRWNRDGRGVSQPRLVRRMVLLTVQDLLEGLHGSVWTEALKIGFELRFQGITPERTGVLQSVDRHRIDDGRAPPLESTEGRFE